MSKTLEEWRQCVSVYRVKLCFWFITYNITGKSRYQTTMYPQSIIRIKQLKLDGGRHKNEAFAIPFALRSIHHILGICSSFPGKQYTYLIMG